MKTPGLEVPPEMRAFAEKSVEEAKKAFETYMDAATKAINTAESSAGNMQEGARELGRKAFGFAEDNVAASFGSAAQFQVLLHVGRPDKLDFHVGHTRNT